MVTYGGRKCETRFLCSVLTAKRQLYAETVRLMILFRFVCHEPRRSVSLDFQASALFSRFVCHEPRRRAFIWVRVLESALAADSVLRFEKELSQQFPADQKYYFEE